MSARGEGSGQPSTSAQGQPAAPAPQKRGRGRPRKQQQVSTRAGWGRQPTSAPSARGPRRAATRARESSGGGRGALPAGRGGGLRSPRRECTAKPRGARAPRGGEMRHGGRRREVGSGEARPRTFAIVHGPEWRDVSSRRSGRGPTTQGSPGTFRAALQLPGGGGGKEVRGGEVQGRRGAPAGRGWRGRSPGGRRLFLPPTGAARGPGLARRSRPLGALPKFSVARDSLPPDKELVGPPGPLRAL